MALTFLLAAAGLACHPAVGGAGEPFDTAGNPTYVYRCEGDERFVASVQGDSVRIRRDGIAETLPLVPATSGATYALGEITFWSRGSEARLQTASDTLFRCVGARAATPWEVSRLLGYDLRGIGQEPGWMVEIDADRVMHVLADYGAVEFFTDRPSIRSADGGVRRYSAPSPAGEVVVDVRSAPCQDVMSGEPFPLRITLQLGAQTYEGCGRRLR